MEKYVTIFVIAWFSMGIIPLYMFISGSSKAKKMFEGISSSRFIFNEKKASGYSKKSFFTKMGGARNVLEVIVTEKELCIKGIMSVFTFIGTKYDLTHRVPLDNILNASMNGKAVELRLKNREGRISDLVLVLKNPEQFLRAINIGWPSQSA